MGRANFGDLKVSTCQGYAVDPSLIKVDGNFSRDVVDWGHVNTLVESMREFGQETPVLCRKVGEDLVLVVGEHRLRAILELQKENPDIKIKFNLFQGNEEDAMLANLEENLRRRDLNAADYGKIVYGLMTRLNMSQADIAKKLGCSLPQVGNYLKVYQAPKEVRDALAEGRIKSTEAVSIARSKNPLVVLERRLNGEGSTADVIRESGELRPRTATDIRKLCRLYPESPLSKALMEFLRGGDPSALETEVAHYPIEEDGEGVETVETSPADTY